MKVDVSFDVHVLEKIAQDLKSIKHLIARCEETIDRTRNILEIKESDERKCAPDNINS